MSTIQPSSSDSRPARPSASVKPAGVASDAANATGTAHGEKTDTVFGKLEIPETAQPIRMAWDYTIVLTLVHILAVVALLPGNFGYLFSWTGVVVAFLGHLLFGMMGVTIGYHRLLTHQGFTCPKWFERTLAVLGICTLQDSPARWVAIHRQHHKHSDEHHDPHSPLVNFFWGHMGWLFVTNRDHVKVSSFEKYVRDLLRDPFYLRLEKSTFLLPLWLQIYVAHAILFFVGGYIAGGFIEGTTPMQFGLSMFFWGVVIRTVAVLHGTWSVNSLSHTFGYRNYETSDNSRNNFFVALISHGEGWHNNHHHDQRAASHGHLPAEFDMSWWVIRGLEMVGIAKNVVRPRVWKEQA